MHQQSLPGFETAPAMQGHVAGLKGDQHGGSLVVGHARRNPIAIAGVGQGVLGEAAPRQGGYRHQAGAQLDPCIGPGGHDFAGNFESRGEGQLRAQLVGTPAQQVIAEIQRRGANPDAHLIGCGFGFRDSVFEDERLLGPTMGVDPPCLHALLQILKRPRRAREVRQPFARLRGTTLHK